MKKLLMVLLAGAAAAGCHTGTNTAKTPNTALANLFNSYYEDRMQLFPLEATFNGDNRYNDQLPVDFTDSYRAKLKTFFQRYQDSIGQYKRDELSENDQVSYDIFTYEMKTSLDGLQFHDNYMPANQFWGLTLTLGQLGSGEGAQPFKTVQDYDMWLKRAAGFSAWTDSAIAYFGKGIADSTVLPRTLVVKVIPQMDAMVTPDATKSIFYGPIAKMPATFSDADKKRLTDAYVQLIKTQLVPAYLKLGTYLKTQYLPHARSTSGISAIPNGDKYYAYLAHYWTTTNKQPEDIYNTGLSEVKRIRGLMDSVKTAVHFNGSLDSFFQYMKTNPLFTPYKTPKEVLDAFHSIHARMTPNLAKMFGRTPKTPFEIRQTEAFRAASASAEYNQGSPDGTRPGIFYVPIVDATKFNTTSGMESLFLHEAIPGHHYQISLTQENNDLPKFRRFLGYGAYQEGWALYCESLGKELGLYTDPYQYMGALGDEMHRAVRLVVDVAIHTKGMTREEAIKYMMENEPISEDGATAEIERYMAIPGQALSYKIGALKIRELRNKYEQQLGAKFKLSAFHDEFLKDGAMPLDVIEKKMDAWAAKQ
ncbi:DUF885 domain-containing protein [Deminuibacter soli]|uniref:DUF885 domain-containing protein n=1 Tax=Deminuibacter soli TaxID=2291815 RepID=A0A3E1NRA8_9BACT|nr:DUF885 domain-containing protein [Deminuibacter soli]RFM30472.1 DUF885 domain-containing protein [Deminuibacter soli]